jgi:peptidoglycan/xylan/chitin deacetylase (PgdA/CDA1 family)
MLLKNIGLKIVGWTFPSGDAFNSNTDAIIENVLKRARPGAVIVFHLSGSRYAPKTLDAILRIIPALKKQGYEFVTVSKLQGRSL